MSDTMPQVVIITGMSGAGRTECLHYFEDHSYYCVDNLPADMLLALVNHGPHSSLDTGADSFKYCVVCDARNGAFFLQLKENIQQLKAQGINCQVLFLDANDKVLVSRFKASRRRHPLCDADDNILAGIAKERRLTFSMKETATYVVDTSGLLPNQLRSKLVELFSAEDASRGMAITVFSFGYKHGVPADADILMDVRFLPNPYYEPTLKCLTGLDEKVADYVLYRPETRMFLKRWHDLLDEIVPGYLKEGKQQLSIGVGCTGGQHRSVVLACETGEFLKSQGYRVSVAHRDLNFAEVKQDSGDNSDNSDSGDNSDINDHNATNNASAVDVTAQEVRKF